MEFSEEEIKIQEEACGYLKAHSDELIDQFILQKKPFRLGFMSLFMAGSPGAGKTEFSQRYLPKVLDQVRDSLKKRFAEKGLPVDNIEALLVRIDVDEIRGFLPQYKKTDLTTGQKANAHVIQKAANKGLDILRSYCLENEISFLLDGTFGNLKTMKGLIQASLDDDRQVDIFFIYLDPISAWAFTQAREAVEGRNILKEKFIEQYFNSQANVEAVKKEFGDSVRLNVVLKNKDNQVAEVKLNVPSLDGYLKSKYKDGSLVEYSEADLLKAI